MGKSKVKSEPTIEDKYQKLDHREHVLLRPGMYIGSIERDNGKMQVYDDNIKKIVTKEMKFTPGFYKTFDEIISNAFDHTTREKTCNKIKVWIDKDEGMIKIFNNGPGIPVTIHKEHKMYVPEMIFGNLLTGTNYDDNEERTCIGLNGLGSKLCNIYAHRFIVETVDTEYGKRKYVQEFRNNMTEKDEPTITKLKSKDTSYTCITYYPDFEKFGMKKMSNDDVAWMKKRAYDIAACTRDDVEVYVDDEYIDVQTFEDYINMCYEDEPILFYSEVNDRWKIGVVFTQDNGGNNISFVNGTSTYEGGNHVDYILDQIVDGVAKHIKMKHKLTVKPMLIKEHLDLFVDSTIVNPEFPSQTKSKLTTKPSKFGSKCEVPKKILDQLYKTKLIEIVVKNAQFKEANALNKTDGKKTSQINIPKLEDARWAGTRKASECRLFLTEGDSAFSFFKSGLDKIGKDRYGGFPLRGKLLNVRNATVDKIKNNEEFIALKKIMGLRQDKKYTDVKDLRYGGIVILADQDLDGIHIKGLIINLFHYFWPELVQIKGFIQTMSTPLIKTWKKTDKTKKDALEFFAESKFDAWSKTVDIKKYEVKYFKGLGTSDDRTARKAFVNFDKKVVSFIWEKPEKPEKTEKPKKTDDSDSDNSSNSDSDNESDNDTKDSKSSKKSNLSPQKGGVEKAKRKKGKKGKLEKVIDNPDIINSKSHDKLTMAFDEERADDRKEWLSNYDKNDILEYDKQSITFSEFIDKDLKHYSNYDNIRSIPSLVDGFKPSQRKIMYICLEDNIKRDIKVIDLASEVSKRTAYKHGNTSLEETIVGMAQDFTGSNNINLLYPNGNFGHRRVGGDDRASSRYIFTFMENITSKIFLKADDYVLNHLQEDGKSVEPETFFPILPMVLVNGAHGIGTGFSTSVPRYNPVDICKNLLRLLDGEEMEEIIPWYQGFNGHIEKEKEKVYRVCGTFDIKDSSTINVTEIPICGFYCWQNDYENKILRPMAGMNVPSKDDKKKKETEKRKKETEKRKKVPVPEILTKYDNDCGNNTVDFKLHFKGAEMQKLIKRGEVEDRLKLSSTISATNMYLYNIHGAITKYNSPLEIMQEFFDYRLDIYVKRKAFCMKLLNNELEILKQKVRFIKDYLADKIIVAKRKRDDVIEQIVKRAFPKLSKKVGAEEHEKTYDYITDMKLFSLTLEKIDELNKEYENKQKEYDDYNSTTEVELWKREIMDFQESYQKWLLEKEERNEDDDDGNGKIKSKKKIKKKK